MEHVGGGGDGIGAQIELQASLLGSSDEAVSRSLVTCDIHIASRLLVLRLHTVDAGGSSVGVVSVVVAGLYHLDICFSDGRLLGELLLQEVGHKLQVAVKEPAHETQCKHVAALHHRLHVHTRVSQAILHHRRQRALDHAIGVDTHFAEIVFSLELCLLQILRTERVCVDDDGCPWLGVAVLCLQRCGVHSHEHIALVARRIYLARTDVYLETRNARERSLRGTDVSGVVGESGNAVTNGGTDRREDVSSELHTVAGVTREADYNLVQLLHF